MVDSASSQITARHGTYQTAMQNAMMAFAPRGYLLQLVMNANSMTSVMILFAAEGSAPILSQKAYCAREAPNVWASLKHRVVMMRLGGAFM